MDFFSNFNIFREPFHYFLACILWQDSLKNQHKNDNEIAISGYFATESAQNCAKVQSHIAHLKLSCTHAHLTHFSEWISHAHAHVRCAVAHVRVRAKSILNSVQDVRACGSFFGVRCAIALLHTLHTKLTENATF